MTEKKKKDILIFVYEPIIKRYIIQEAFTFQDRVYYSGEHLTEDQFEYIKLHTENIK